MEKKFSKVTAFNFSARNLPIGFLEQIYFENLNLDLSTVEW